MAETKDVTGVKVTKAADDRFHKVANDVVETLPDGRRRLVARKGQQFTRAQALELGLVKENTPGPAETKVSTPTDTKGAKGDAK